MSRQELQCREKPHLEPDGILCEPVVCHPPPLFQRVLRDYITYGNYMNVISPDFRVGVRVRVE